MKVILETYDSDEGYSRNVGTKLDIYVCITGFQNKSVRYIKNVITEIQ